MKKHNGMRPQDVVILLKIASLENKNWLIKDLAHDLFISQSEVSESLNRSALGKLIADDKKTLLKKGLLEFLIYGLPHVFPEQPGSIAPGIPTAHSAPPLNKKFKNAEVYVWPDLHGDVKGQVIEPLYTGQVKAAKLDHKLHELLALTDAMRVGRAREKKMAEEELTKRLLK